MVPRGAGTPSEEPTRTAGRGREQPRQDRVWPTRRDTLSQPFLHRCGKHKQPKNHSERVKGPRRGMFVGGERGEGGIKIRQWQMRTSLNAMLMSLESSTAANKKEKRESNEIKN